MMGELQIIYRNPADLIPYANNAKIHSDGQITKIASSIKEFGFNAPILLDGDKGLIAGHGRREAALKLSMDSVPTIDLVHLSEAQKKAYILADNRLGDEELGGTWDMDMVNIELQGLVDMDFDVELTGFDLELDDPEFDGLTDPDEVPEVDEGSEPVSQQGMIWLCGEHRVMCGDSTSETDVVKLVNGQKINLVFTDPPYGIDIVSSNTSTAGGGGATKFSGSVGGGKIVAASNYMPIKGDDTTDAARAFFHICKNLNPDTQIIWGGNYFTDFLPPSMCWIVWDKQNTGNFADVELAWCSDDRGAKLYSFLWNGMSREGDRKSEGKSRIHPTQKPVNLFCRIFDDFNGENILDGFAGSGSTLIAATKANKTSFNLEFESFYVDEIVKRWQDFTGRQATLEGDGRTFNEISEF